MRDAPSNTGSLVPMASLVALWADSSPLVMPLSLVTLYWTVHRPSGAMYLLNPHIPWFYVIWFLLPLMVTVKSMMAHLALISGVYAGFGSLVVMNSWKPSRMSISLSPSMTWKTESHRLTIFFLDTRYGMLWTDQISSCHTVTILSSALLMTLGHARSQYISSLSCYLWVFKPNSLVHLEL